MNRKICVLLAVALTTIMSVMFLCPPITHADATSISNEIISYISGTDDLFWSGAANYDVDGLGYIVPPSNASWINCAICQDPSWEYSLGPPNLSMKFYKPPMANWIWKSTDLSLGESTTGDIVFFKKPINIPNYAANIKAELLMTADNAYYFYLSNPAWSGTPIGIANFVSGYSATDFYYVSDGQNNISGGNDSVPYETPGHLYPLEAAIQSTPFIDPDTWVSVESWDISKSLHPGENWLQIVGINEHAPPDSRNPAGLIYKLTVSYEKLYINITLTGGLDYTTEEDVKIRVAALAEDPNTFEPISDANATTNIYYPNDTLWISGTMTEKPAGTGIYQWESNDTIYNMKLAEGVYLVYVTASIANSPTTSAILMFHIDPPAQGESSPSTPLIYIAIATIALVAGTMTGIALLRRRKKPIAR
jgi:hypothetical protein